MKERTLVYSAQDAPLFELAPDEVFALQRTEELNGAHELEITTTRVLMQGMRVLRCDAMGTWREYVVSATDERHASGERLVGTYTCVWSIQYDLSGVTCDAMPGVKTPVSASAAMDAALGNTSRWTRGTVDVGGTSGGSMWQRSAWEALGVLVENWGGEIDAEITVDATGVVTRSVALRQHIGSETAVRRFDYRRDLTGISRKASQGVVYARIVPLGAGVADEDGSITGDRRRVTIESVNSGVEWLQDSETVDYAKVPNGSGGWEYPTRFVIYDGIETPAALKEAALADIHEQTVPAVTYSADVVQLAEAGMDAHGIALGDECQCVDREFGGDGLRVTGRVVKLVINELDPAGDTSVTIGHVGQTLADAFRAVSSSVKSVDRGLATLQYTTADYLENIIDNLNAEINATGGYTYLTDGQGIRTYDRAVTDPLVGTEATKVVEIKGGSIRIADSKTAQGAWEWKTVFTSGHVAADLVTAAQLTAGYIGSAASGNYWDLDTGELRMSTSAKVGNQTIAQYIAQVAPETQLNQTNVFNALTNNGAAQGMFISNGQLYVNATYLRTGIIADAANKNFWNMQTGEFSLSPNAVIGATTVRDVTSLAQDAYDAASGEVGGTNLLIDSDAPSLTKVAASAGRKWVKGSGVTCTQSFVSLSSTERPVSGVTKGAQFAFAASQLGKYAGICFYNGKSARLLDGQKYTVSCWARSTSGKGDVQFQYGQTSYKASKKMSIAGTWKRYSWTFTFSQSAAGGTGGARVYFNCHPIITAASTIRMCGFKLEVGAKATDWAPSPEDTSYSVRVEAANAKEFTNSVSKADRDYTTAQRAAIDESFNQAKVFNRLTNNGAAQAITLKSGQLYINASYLKAGTINAGIIKAGILADAVGKNRWNLATGSFATKNADLESCKVVGALSSGTNAANKAYITINEGRIDFKHSKEQALQVIGGSETISEKGKQPKTQSFAKLEAQKNLYFRTPRLSVSNNLNSAGYYWGYTGVIEFDFATHGKSSGTNYWNAKLPQFGHFYARFVNGILVEINVRT